MPTPRALNLVVDSTRGSLLAGFEGSQPALLPAFYLSDGIPVSLRVVTVNNDPSTNADYPWADMDLTGQSVRIGIGIPGKKPAAGTFVLSYGGDDSVPLAPNISERDLESALNVMPSIIAAGKVRVARGAAGFFKVAFLEAGVRTSFTADALSLYPNANVGIRVYRPGTIDREEIVQMSLESLPGAAAELDVDFPRGEIQIGELIEFDENISTQTFVITGAPYGGSFLFLRNTEGNPPASKVPIAATHDEIRAAIKESYSIPDDQPFGVSGTWPEFVINWQTHLGGETYEVPEIAVDDSGLVYPVGRSGLLDLNTAGCVELLNGAASIGVRFEVEVVDIATGVPWTTAQVPAILAKDVLSNDPDAPSPLPFPGVAEMAVLYDRDQDLADEERWRALGNLKITFDEGKLFVVCPDGVTRSVILNDP